MMNHPGSAEGGRGLLSGVPKNTTIKGQDHELIYANGPEIDLLQKRGGGRNADGSQVMGPGNVRAFPAPGDGAGNDNGAGSESSGGSTGGGEAGGSNGSAPGSEGYGGGSVGAGNNTDAEGDVADAEAAAAAAGRGGATSAGSQADAQAAENDAQGKSNDDGGIAGLAIRAFTRFGMIPAVEEVAKDIVGSIRDKGFDVATGRDPGFSGTDTTDNPGDDSDGTGPGGTNGSDYTDPTVASSTVTDATRTDQQPTSTGTGLLPGRTGSPIDGLYR